MGHTVQVKLYHSLTYTTDGVVPVHLVAKSLLANERLIHESLLLLEGLDEDFKIDSASQNFQMKVTLKEAMSVTAFASNSRLISAAAVRVLPVPVAISTSNCGGLVQFHGIRFRCTPADNHVRQF